MILGKPYFYTATIRDWHTVIKDNAFEEIIIQSLRFLTDKKLIQVYGMVIMPNHVHLIWEMMALNKKETPISSFMKFTSHKFLEKLRQKDKNELQSYEVEWISRKHNFWQKDSLAIELFTEKVFLQKLNYLHNNPLQEKWKLASVPEAYFYSSAKFYFTGGKENDFRFIKHYQDRI